ncbi:MAG: restriction endonuclease subunit S [Blautia hansenii]
MQKKFTPDEGGVFPEWEEVEFGKLFQRRSEKNGEEFGVEKTISVATMHFKPEGNKAAEESLPKYRVLRKGDIAYEGNKSKHFKHGRFVLNDIGDGIISPIFEVLQPVSELSKEVPEFWKYYINYEPVMGKILAKCANTGIMMNRLAIKDFYKQKIKVPCIEEQRKIAAALSAYDEMIAVKTAKLEIWQECKKRMAKEIFGRTKRFKDDDGREFPEWEEKTLGEITEYVRNGYSYKPDGVRTHKYKVTRIETISTGKINPEKLGSCKECDEKYLLKPGDILYSNINSLSYLGNTAIYKNSSEKIYHGMNLLCIRPKGNDIDADYLFAFLNSEAARKFVKYNAQRAVNQCSIKVSDVRNMRIPLPCMEEQQKIGSFLVEIDKEIEIQKEFIKTYAEGKKRMMRELMEG